MVLADLGRKITTALHSLSKATIINEEVSGRARHCFDSTFLKLSLLTLRESYFVTFYKSRLSGPQRDA